MILNPMIKIDGIKAISFDADNTLWDFDKVMRRSLSYILKELDRIDPSISNILTIDKMIEIRNKVGDELKGKVTNLEIVRFEAFCQTLREIGRPDDRLAHHLNQIYLKHRFEDIELFDDVIPILEVLKTKYMLGVISNGNTDPKRCGLKRMFRFVVLSQDYGIEKPDTLLFQIALEKAGCNKSELLHVGDSLDTDIIGAILAGIKSIWLNRKRKENNLNIKADYEILSLREMLDILK
jgi:FMN hydrolase / 5-amino-6-(5-phospho-D-ribitylamino)uracil phosphatase